MSQIEGTSGHSVVATPASLHKEEENEEDSETTQLLRSVSQDKVTGEAETGDCRICQETDTLDNLDKPCACAGSMLYAHPSCIEKWVNEKGDAVCEVCHTPLEGYRPATPDASQRGDLSESEIMRELHNMLEAARQANMTENGAMNHQLGLRRYASYMWIRMCVIMVMCWLFMRMFFEATETTSNQQDAQNSTEMFMVFLIRFLGPLIPFMLMYQAVMALRVRQQLAARAAANDISWMFSENERPQNGHFVQFHRMV